jgi:tripartite-type tricarboxylate transporter receptor subunit TctC
MKVIRRFLLMAGVGMALGIGPATAFPDQPIRVIVPFAAGAGADATARLYQKLIQEHELLSQPLAIVNVPGAGGSIGAREVKDAAPDGYTILFTHIPMLSNQAMGVADFGFRDFAPIAGTVESCLVQTVMDSSPYTTLDELMAAAREQPDSIVYGVSIGAINHKLGLLLERSADGAKFRFANIGGGAENISALRGGTTQTAVFSLGQYQNQLKDLGMRALALLADERHPDVPDLPTAREIGYDASLCLQYTWYAPKDTPADVVATIAEALRQAQDLPEFKHAAAADMQTVSFITGQELFDRLEADYARIQSIADAAK